LATVQRLKTRPQFQAALAGGTVSRTAHFALHRLILSPVTETSPAPAGQNGSAPSPEQALFVLPAQAVVWMGAMVPKRWARRAVTRNAIKRQIYNVSERFADRLPVAAHVVRLRTTFDRKQFVSATSEPLKLAVRQELEQLFERAVLSERRT
jgi:ribonuclease P protein component